MRNRPVRRWAAALLNLLFLLAWGEPASAHPCPMHDGAALMAATGPGTPAPVAAAHAAAHAAGHGHHDAAAALPATAPAHGGDASHACQCLGDCSAASAAALPGAVAVRWQGIVRHAAEPPAAQPGTPRAASPRLLPFANGPPRSA
jgi:hypothetical protein